VRALLAAVAVTAAELGARRAIRSRSRAWLVAYGALGAASLALAVQPRRAPVHPARLAAGLGLALTGYPLGRALLGSRPTRPPPDGLAAELAALGALVPLVEERVWGGLVEPAIGSAATALTFASKHPLIDGSWDRLLGLALFWWGLAQVRRVSPRAALAVHCAVNTGGVLLGHATGRDQFS
jgi:hypothetical protein